MRSAFVADSSVGVAWAVLSQSSPATEYLLDDVASGTPFVVPVLWTLEVANALLVLARRKRIEPQDYARARRALARLTPVIDEDAPRMALGKISDLAEEHGLSIYAAAYLDLAVRRGLSLASRDADLNKAARRCGVEALL